MSSSDHDRLGSLPDPVLHQILSLLPTKHAVQTSVISRRFRDLWKSSVDLSFSDEDFRTLEHDVDVAESLSNFIESVLLLRDRSFEIRRFRLRCSIWIQQKRLSTWIRVVCSGNLRELDVSIPGCSDLPNNVFTCASLRELVLRMQDWEIRLPSAIKLCNLRILRISDVDFLNGDERKLGELISTCPALVHLELRHCYLTSLHVKAERLERFTFHHYDYNDVKIRLSTPKLEFLEHICEGTEDFLLGHLPCLMEGSFDLRGYTWSGLGDIVDILRGLSNARVLTLTDFAITFPLNNHDLMGNLPVFDNLRNLKLINSLKRDIFQSVKCLLQCVPNLETLTIEQPVPYEIYPFLEDERSYWKTTALPIDYFDRVENINVKQTCEIHGTMYYIVNISFRNVNPCETNFDG